MIIICLMMTTPLVRNLMMIPLITANLTNTGLILTNWLLNLEMMAEVKSEYYNRLSSQLVTIKCMKLLEITKFGVP